MEKASKAERAELLARKWGNSAQGGGGWPETAAQ